MICWLSRFTNSDGRTHFDDIAQIMINALTGEVKSDPIHLSGYATYRELTR
jgi:hypothetical protein